MKKMFKVCSLAVAALWMTSDCMAQKRFDGTKSSQLTVKGAIKAVVSMKWWNGSGGQADLTESDGSPKKKAVPLDIVFGKAVRAKLVITGPFEARTTDGATMPFTVGFQPDATQAAVDPITSGTPTQVYTFQANQTARVLLTVTNPDMDYQVGQYATVVEAALIPME